METVGTAAPRGMRTFLFIWLGQLISILGSGMTSFALGVWIFRETGSATPFALTVLFFSLPRILLMPLAGMLADRLNRRWLMILSDTGSAVVTLLVVLLVSTGRLEIWHIYLTATLNSIFSAFQEPAYRASVIMLVPKQHLARASGMMNASDAIQLLLSPLLAGVLFGIIGLGGIIMIDFATFFFAVGALLLVRIPQPKLMAEETKQKASLRRDTAFAWRYLTARPGLFWMVWYFALVNFLLNVSAVLIGPLVLSHADASQLGLVQVAGGFGMLAGSITIGAWGGPRRRIRGVVGFIALAALGMALAGLRESFLVTAAGMFLLLFSIPIASGCSMAITQSKIEPSVQGRVMAMRGMISQSMMPLAFVLAGPLADRVFGPLMLAGGSTLASGPLGLLLGTGPGRGIGLMFLLSGGILVLVSALAWSNVHIRRVEDQLPDVQIHPAEPTAPIAQPTPAEQF
jgi:MFS transporter, DHA3 family, macrolide efflux protein